MKKEKDTYTMPTNLEEIKTNLIKFNDICNRIFKGNKDVFYTEKQIKELKSDKELQKKNNIEFI